MKLSSKFGPDEVEEEGGWDGSLICYLVVTSFGTLSLPTH